MTGFGEGAVVGKSAQEAVQRYQVLFAYAPDIILFMNREGKLKDVNPAALAAYGYDYATMLNLSVADLFVDGRNRLHELEEKTEVLFEGWQKRRDGTRFPVEVHYQKTFSGHKGDIMAVIRDQTERQAARRQLQHLATHDFLTDIPNRYLLETMMRRWLRQGRSRRGALLFIDIDNFKVVNDTFGHAAGDRLLQGLVGVLQQQLTEQHFLARLGGDEFAVLLREADCSTAQRVAERLRRSLEAAEVVINQAGTVFPLTTSIGIVLMDGTLDPQQLLACADMALYEAKNNGKNRVVVLQENAEPRRLMETNQLIGLLGSALRGEGFFLQYQPIHSEGGHILHYEALLRLRREDGTLLPPAAFIPLAERCGLMSQIDRWVVREVLHVLQTQDSLHVFINLSGVSLGDAALLQDIRQAVQQSGIAAGRLGFEITETSAVKDLVRADCWIRELKALGCRFALDDFGVGFCSFTHLEELPVDYVKIDGSFVLGLAHSATKQAIVKAINDIVRTLGKEAIAEFVEDEAILLKLQELEVPYSQGYYWGRPTTLPF